MSCWRCGDKLDGDGKVKFCYTCKVSREIVSSEKLGEKKDV